MHIEFCAFFLLFALVILFFVFFFFLLERGIRVHLLQRANKLGFDNTVS